MFVRFRGIRFELKKKKKEPITRVRVRLTQAFYLSGSAMAVQKRDWSVSMMVLNQH